ncbi:MAG: DMT family transporter [Rhizobiales bacterium]|nr:DMT family transporter [Hyphomicrobiales bacterium]
MNRPLLLLLGTGAALGLNFPIGKLAMAAGINPALWAAIISLGAGLAMLIVAGMAERNRTNGASVLQFAILSGFISYVAPNFITFSVIPKIGSGLAAIMYALSPVVTALLSILLRVRPPSLLEVIGIAFGLAGAIIIIVYRNADFSPASLLWLLAALLIPVFLGVGNIYRTLAWPEGASPRWLAAMTNLAAVPPLVLAAVVTTGTLDLAPLATVPGLVALQIAVSTVMFLMFFRLQQLGGPTYLSQIGYVAAAVGVVIGVAYLGESYPVSVWLGAGVIAFGIALSTLAQIRQAKPSI